MSAPLLASYDLALLASYDLALWTIALGAITNVACAMLGCYLVLRRMSLMGDAISHAVLPGIVVGFVWSQSLVGWGVFIGAIALGLLTAVLSHSLTNYAHVPEDSSMGVVFTSLFALGVFLLTNLARNVDLDPSCVLYGLIEAAPLDTVSWWGLELPRTLGPMLAALLLTCAFVAVFWKELKLTSFDPALATAMGLRAGIMHYALMAMVAVVTVASFEAVGSIIVIAMLVVPAATAHLLTDRLGSMMAVAVGIAVVSSILGYWSAAALDTTVAGMMGVAAGVQLAAAVLFSPRYGLLGKLANQVALSQRIVREDLVGLLYRTEELAARSRSAQPRTLSWGQAMQALGGGMAARFAALSLWRRGAVRFADGALLLSDAGRGQARSLVRSHRLWEAFLSEHFQLPLDHVHAAAERIEHFIGPQLQEILAEQLHAPAVDPHGRTIPPGA